MSTIKHYHHTLLHDVPYVELLQRYRSPLISLLVAVLAFYFGKWKARSNQFERYINSFINSTKTESELIARQRVYERARGYKRYATLAVVLCCVALSAYCNFGTLADRSLGLFGRLQRVQQNGFNVVLAMLLTATLALSYLSGRYLKYTQASIGARLDSIKTNKSLYVEKFFDLIGPEMIREIRKFLVRDAEKDEARHRELESRMADVQARFRGVQARCAAERTKFEAYKQFADGIMRFEWCEVCYSLDNRSAFAPRAEAGGKGDAVANEQSERVGAVEPEQRSVAVKKAEGEEVRSKFGIEHATESHAETELRNIDEVLSEIDKSQPEVVPERKCTVFCLERFLCLCEDIGNRLADNVKGLDLN